LWGVTANNNPTVQDVWNTIPAWRFPFISSALAPTPTASTFIDQVYAQQVVGVSAYTFLDDMLYLEFGAIARCRPTRSSCSASTPRVRARSVA